MLAQDGTLNQDLKLFVNSANGKQETDFAKGKRMTPVEANLYVQRRPVSVKIHRHLDHQSKPAKASPSPASP